MQLYVVGFLFDEAKKRVLLIEKKKPAWQAGKLNGVGGKIEVGEMPEAAMVREFEEETGLNFIPFKRFCRLTHSTAAWSVYFFVSFSNQLDYARQMPGEDEKPVVVDVDNLPENIVSNLKWLIPLALDPSETVVIDAADFTVGQDQELDK
jgi:8-oxo-dGTP diphosphatase